MTISRRDCVFGAAFVTLAACAGATREVPAIAPEPGQSDVRVINDGAGLRALDESCTQIEQVTEADGIVGPARSSYDGTRERAILRLRNRAVLLGGDTVLVHEGTVVPDPLAIDGSVGSVVALNATIYRCKSPNSPK